MTRVTVSAVAMACVAAATVPGFAAPASVDQGRAATARMTLSLPDGATLDLDLRAARMSAGPQLRIETSRCDEAGGCSEGTYVSALPADALTIDPSAAVATLRTQLAGRALSITWKPANGTVIGSGYVEGGGDDATASHFAGDAATATVEFIGHTCSGDGGVGQEIAAAVDLSEDGVAGPLTGLRLPEGATLRC